MNLYSYTSIKLNIYTHRNRPATWYGREDIQGWLPTMKAYLLVMKFKHRRQANTDMPANTAMPMFLTSCEVEMHKKAYS